MKNFTCTSNINIILLAALTILISACSEIDTVIEESEFKKNVVLLSNLEEGQSSKYIRYVAACNPEYADFGYTGDTLILTVKKQADELYFEERITEFSTMFTDEMPNKVFSHKVYGDGEMLLIPERFESRLFFFFGNDTIPVMEKPTTELIQRGCQLFQTDNPFIGNDIGQFDTFSVGDIEQRNKRAISCVPLHLVLDAYLIYNDHKLYQSHTISTSQNFPGSGIPRIEGWVLLE